MRLSHQLQEAILVERKALPIGATRTWKSGRMVKIAPGKWAKESPGNVKRAKKKASSVKLKSTIDALKTAIDKGTVDIKNSKTGKMESHDFGTPGMTFKEYSREARQEKSKAIKRLDGLLNELKELSPSNASVKGRPKDIESILGKMMRKPGSYKRPSQLQDVTGTRIVADTIGEVDDTVKKIEGRFKVIENEDKIRNPQGDYRSVHLIIEDDDGVQKEVQVRTKNQDVFADWAHDVYKPMTKEQEEALEKNKNKIDEFSHGMSEFFYAQDMGKNPPPPPRPDCPGAVSSSFGCI